MHFILIPVTYLHEASWYYSTTKMFIKHAPMCILSALTAHMYLKLAAIFNNVISSYIQ